MIIIAIMIIITIMIVIMIMRIIFHALIRIVLGLGFSKGMFFIMRPNWAKQPNKYDEMMSKTTLEIF